MSEPQSGEAEKNVSPKKKKKRKYLKIFLAPDVPLLACCPALAFRTPKYTTAISNNIMNRSRSGRSRSWSSASKPPEEMELP
jgi:hypothetical protein